MTVFLHTFLLLLLLDSRTSSEPDPTSAYRAFLEVQYVTRRGPHTVAVPCRRHEAQDEKTLAESLYFAS